MALRLSRHRFLSLTLSPILALSFAWGCGHAAAQTPLTTPATTAAAATPVPTDQSKETLITADNMASDQATGVVTATGHVEIARSNYILHADKVTYTPKTGVMHAEGHVALLTPSGEVEFSDKQDVTGDMKQAFAENVGIIFPDNSRLVAPTVQRYDGRYLVADHGLYTSCNVCKTDPNNPPLWQMRADQIVQDNVEHEVYYHNATMDFDGVPVFYTPYYSAPDPTVDRRQGFLTPTAGVNANIGAFLELPYYFDIAPDFDATLTPYISQDDKLTLGGQIRKRFDDGSLQFTGSFTHTDLISVDGTDEGPQWRGYLFGDALFDLDNVWRAGADIQMASDKSYLDRYNISSLTQLTNRFYVEGFQGRDYAAVNNYYFEDLTPGTTIVQPLVLPEASFSALGEPGQTWGGRWSMNGNMLVTSRDNSNQGLNQQGPDTRRLYYDAGWQRQFISNTGLVTTISTMARLDAESADNVTNPDGSGNNFDDVLTAHQFEQADATMRYPVSRQGDGYSQLVEPLVELTAAPVVHRDPRQPVEDSADVSFDETNLFAANRFTGYDLIEGGSRATYGIRQAITGDGGARIDMFGGQSYTFNRTSDFPALSGLQDQVSDYVGRVEFVPTDWLSFNYGFRLDHTTLSPQRQDALLSVGEPIFRPYIHYISGYIYDTTNVTANTPGYFSGDVGTLTASEEAIIGFDSHFAKYWTFHAEHTQAFSPEPGPRISIASISYADECYIFAVTLSQDDLTRADLSSGTSVMFHMFLKNVGGIHSDSFSPTHDSFPTQFEETE